MESSKPQTYNLKTKSGSFSPSYLGKLHKALCFLKLTYTYIRLFFSFVLRQGLLCVLAGSKLAIKTRLASYGDPPVSASHVLRSHAPLYPDNMTFYEEFSTYSAHSKSVTLSHVFINSLHVSWFVGFNSRHATWRHITVTLVPGESNTLFWPLTHMVHWHIHGYNIQKHKTSIFF